MRHSLFAGCLCVAMTLASGCLGGKPMDPGRGSVLAVVAGKPIFQQDVRDRLLARYYGKRALLGVIREQLFLLEAVELGVTVEPEAVSRRVEEELDSMFGELGASKRQLLQDLETRGLSLEDLRAELTREMETRLLIENVARAHRVVSDAQIAVAYERTYKNTRVRLSHIAFAFGIDGEPSAEVVESTKQRAADIHARIVAGGNFSALARKHSENPDTARGGGEIGWVTEQALSPPMSEAAFSLKVGATSQPVRERDYGFHLLRVDERADAQPLSQVREQLTEELLGVPPSPSEILNLEQRLRERHPVTLFLEELEN